MLKLQGHRANLQTLAFSPDGRQLVSIATRERHASLWDLPAGTRTLSPGAGVDSHALAFAPDGTAIVTASGRNLRRWDLATGTIEEKWQRVASHACLVAFSPDGSLLAAACYAGGDRR